MEGSILVSNKSNRSICEKIDDNFSIKPYEQRERMNIVVFMWCLSNQFQNYKDFIYFGSLDDDVINFFKNIKHKNITVIDKIKTSLETDLLYIADDIEESLDNDIRYKVKVRTVTKAEDLKNVIILPPWAPLFETKVLYFSSKKYFPENLRKFLYEVKEKDYEELCCCHYEINRVLKIVEGKYFDEMFESTITSKLKTIIDKYYPVPSVRMYDPFSIGISDYFY